MHELVANLHLHTTYSDGTGSHAEIAAAALKCGVDIVIITDHNVLVKGLEGYHRQDGQRVLVLVGEEVHNQARDPQKNHLLIIGANREMATFASSPQHLIDQAGRAGGLTFIAHPYDSALPLFGETDITWVDWDTTGYTGIEIWNGFSEFKTVIKNKMDAVYYAYNPEQIATGPDQGALHKWDELLAEGERVVAVGGSDAHALKKTMGPLRKTIFPYDYHFQAVNTHLLVPNILTSDLNADRKMVLSALASGACFVGYDLPASTRGFRFTAHGREQDVSMGEEIQIEDGITFQIRLPLRTECRLLHNGRVIKIWNDRDICSFIANQPGIYRVECYIDFLGKQRGWIFSNPIYVRPPAFKRSRLSKRS